jgi:hypothetical protein
MKTTFGIPPAALIAAIVPIMLAEAQTLTGACSGTLAAAFGSRITGDFAPLFAQRFSAVCSDSVITTVASQPTSGGTLVVLSSGSPT